MGEGMNTVWSQVFCEEINCCFKVGFGSVQEFSRVVQWVNPYQPPNFYTLRRLVFAAEGTANDLSGKGLL